MRVIRSSGLTAAAAAARQMLDEGDDATLVAEVVLLPGTLVLDQDSNTGVQEGELAQAL
jgi:hypothetical protein